MKAQINLKFILIEVYTFLNGLSPRIIKEVFQTNDCPYDLRIQIWGVLKFPRTKIPFIKYELGRF